MKKSFILIQGVDKLHYTILSAQKIVSGSEDNTVRLWDDMSWETWLQTACNQLRYHPTLVEPTTDEAKEAKKTCQQYVWH